uniref:GOLD domain-containing protein n=1 Tax=Rhinopithecus bieti TaxID=61621 RepID=A0A2K6KL38_RHIBE
MSGLSGPPAWHGPCPLALLLLFLLSPSSVLAISFHLPSNSRKCLHEEIHKDLPVTGTYKISNQSGGTGGLRSHLKITDSVGHIFFFFFFFFETEFRSIMTFEVCFESKGTGQIPDQLVILDMKHGVEVKLQHLEDLSESTVNDFMCDTNESTNTWVLYFSIFSMFCLTGLATWQVFHLQCFFKAKKLIK